MVRLAGAVFGAVVALLAFPWAPHAAADDGQLFTLSGGQVQCAVSPNNMDRGGGPMVVCQLANGLGWANTQFSTEKYPQPLTLAIERGTGEFHYDKGRIAAAPGQGIALGPGQTYHIDGWTIEVDEHRNRFTYDESGHGLLVNPQDVRNF